MQIIDFSHRLTDQPINKSTTSGRLTVEALTAALFFLVPALLLFVLSAK